MVKLWMFVAVGILGVVLYRKFPLEQSQSCVWVDRGNSSAELVSPQGQVRSMIRAEGDKWIGQDNWGGYVVFNSKVSLEHFEDKETNCAH